MSTVLICIALIGLLILVAFAIIELERLDKVIRDIEKHLP